MSSPVPSPEPTPRMSVEQRLDLADATTAMLHDRSTPYDSGVLIRMTATKGGDPKAFIPSSTAAPLPYQTHERPRGLVGRAMQYRRVVQGVADLILDPLNNHPKLPPGSTHTPNGYKRTAYRGVATPDMVVGQVGPDPTHFSGRGTHQQIFREKRPLQGENPVRPRTYPQTRAATIMESSFDKAAWHAREAERLRRTKTSSKWTSKSDIPSGAAGWNGLWATLHMARFNKFRRGHNISSRLAKMVLSIAGEEDPGNR